MLVTAGQLLAQQDVLPYQRAIEAVRREAGMSRRRRIEVRLTAHVACAG